MKYPLLPCLLLATVLLAFHGGQASPGAIRPGEVWNDTTGAPINAHGGGILFHEGAYYWYGELKEGRT